MIEGLGRDRIAALTHREVNPGGIMIRDSRIGQAREFDRTHAIQHAQEIRGRPADDPMRSALEGRDREERNGGGRSDR